MSRESDAVVNEFEVPVGTVRATVSDFKGKRRLDVRLWVEPRDSPGAELIPTSKGINLPAEYADELLEAAQALAAAVRPAAARRRSA